MPAVLNNDDNNSRSSLKKAQHPSRRVVGQKLCLIVLMSVLPSPLSEWSSINAVTNATYGPRYQSAGYHDGASVKMPRIQRRCSEIEALVRCSVRKLSSITSGRRSSMLS
ncbi:hypothetical protein T05_4727 [Trichinella murrelli]|uniref:Uncharacterized protein n=1 Tax=Trichinella murrelli TaxID=144512 RepID=A0A0V0U0S6_9BILA|nr:hypothetical protein T05_4727 [Trichinella murrelli]